MTKVSKIKIEEHQFQRELSKLYEDMGRMVTKYAKDENMVNFSGNQEFFQIIENIEKIQLKIDKKIAEIKKIKEEYNITDVEVDNVIDKTNLDSQIEVEDVPAEINSDENQNYFLCSLVDNSRNSSSNSKNRKSNKATCAYKRVYGQIV